MAPSLVTRTLAITLTLVIAEFQVKSFVISRDDGSTMGLKNLKEYMDMTSEGSSMLQIKDEMKRPNDINNIFNDSKTNSIKNKELLTTTRITTVKSTTDNTNIVSMKDSIPKNVTSSESNRTEPLTSTETIQTIEETPKSNLDTKKTLTISDIQYKEPYTTAVPHPAEVVTTSSAVTTVLTTLPSQELTTVTDQLATDSGIAKSLIEDVNKSETPPTTKEVVVDTTTTTSSTETPKLNSETETHPPLTVTTAEINTFTSKTYELSDTTNPVTKNYVTIERKRTTISKDVEDSHGTDTNELNTSPTTLHEKLREDLTNSHSTTHIEILSKPSKSANTKESSLDSTETTELKSKSTVETKRAGFLDLSKTSPLPTATSVELEAMEKYRQETKHPDADMQIQMSEDAIKEELLRGKVLNTDNESSDKFSGELSTVQQKRTTSVPDDGLSVQPIGQDRRNTLYTIPANYKPMKKIDVQPPKSQVRDPDDNSWRNESISSLGIVFKPKNASKSFKEVLKNKTETEFNNIFAQDKDNKSDVPDLRLRLEKIAEIRKSKKMKSGKSGEVYSDYEENTETTLSPTTTVFNIEYPVADKITTISTPAITTQKIDTKKQKSFDKTDFFKNVGLDFLSSDKFNKSFDTAEYYETTDDYDVDYVTMSNIDLKKFNGAFRSHTSTTRGPERGGRTRPAAPAPDRRPTVQYFPPREPSTAAPQKVNVNDYDDHFKQKVNEYTTQEPFTVPTFKITPATHPVATDRPRPAPASANSRTTPDAAYDYDRDVFPARPVTELHDGNYNRGTYVLRHYKDVLGDAAKEIDYDLKMPEPGPLTRAPSAEGEGARRLPDRDYEEYEARFHADVVSRFVDNFNQNSERFKVDFPVIYNNSIVHASGGGRAASSSALMKRVYADGAGGAVELAPAYELHYYVPEQEERAEPERRYHRR